MKFKVIEQDWYTQFNHPFRYWDRDGGKLTPQEYHDKEYERFIKLSDEPTLGYYDGPFRYIEPCDDPGFPPREGLKYCVRLHQKPECLYYRYYKCYCYQFGHWWVYIRPQTLFTDIHVPQVMDLYTYMNLDCPFKLLSKKAQLDVRYYQYKSQLDNIGKGKWKVKQQLKKFKNDRGLV